LDKLVRTYPLLLLLLLVLLLPPTLASVDPTWDGCNGAWLYEYFASASCVGQGTEATFPYDVADSTVCVASAERTSMQAALNLKWAYVPSGSNADLMKAVTYAPTMIGVYASGQA
jgi:hypothetical protein